MTIVVYDGKKMIADSLATMHEEIKMPGAIKKIIEPETDEYWEINGVKVLAFGFSGMLAAVPYVRELLQQGISYRSVIKPEHDLYFEVLCILETGDCYVLNAFKDRDKEPGHHNLLVHPITPPAAVGCGSVFALAVMGPKEKNQAEKGVEAAIRMSPYCGGEVFTWTLPPVPEVPSKRPFLTVSEILNQDDDKPIKDFSVGQLKEVVGELVQELTRKATQPTKEKA